VACLLILVATAYPTEKLHLTDRGLYFPASPGFKYHPDSMRPCPDGQRRTPSGSCRKVFIRPRLQDHVEKYLQSHNYSSAFNTIVKVS
jgi:hypothetical protein